MQDRIKCNKIESATNVKEDKKQLKHATHSQAFSLYHQSHLFQMEKCQ